MNQHKRRGSLPIPTSDRVTDFQIGDRVKLAGTELGGVVIGKCYGDIRYEVRCDDGAYMRELLPEALRPAEEPSSPRSESP